MLKILGISGFTIVLMSFMLGVSGQTFSEPGPAFTRARESGKPVLLFFSGSDWCIPCIRLEKTIFADSSFRRFAEKNLVMLEADFPQQKKIPPSLKVQYEELAEEFNAEGTFPKIVLLAPNRKFMASLSYSGQKPDELIRQIRGVLPSL